jgi:hypothetical protein
MEGINFQSFISNIDDKHARTLGRLFDPQGLNVRRWEDGDCAAKLYDLIERRRAFDKLFDAILTIKANETPEDELKISSKLCELIHITVAKYPTEYPLSAKWIK